MDTLLNPAHRAFAFVTLRIALIPVNFSVKQWAKNHFPFLGNYQARCANIAPANAQAAA